METTPNSDSAARLLALGKQQLLVGVDWHYAPDEAQARKLAKELARRQRGCKPLRLPNGDGTWLAAAAPGGLLRKGRLLLGAGLVAQALEHGVLVLALDERLVWMSAVAARCIVPHHDAVVPAEQAHALLAQWLSEIGGGSVIGGMQPEQAQPAQEALQQALDGADRATLRALQTGQAPLARMLVLALPVAVAGAAAALWLASKPQPEPAATVDWALIESARQKEEERARQQRLRAAFDEAVRQRRQSLLTLDAGAQLAALLRDLRTASAPQPYGKLVRLRCVPQPMQEQRWQCTPTWSLPQQAGRLARAALAGEAALAQPLSNEMFDGQPYALARPVSGSRTGDWPPLQPDWWRAWLEDQVRVRGWKDAQWDAQAQPVRVQVSSFQENGHALQGVLDAELAVSAAVTLAGPLAQWLDAQWLRWLSQGPAEVREAELIGGRLRAQIVFYRLSAAQ